jgi:hypothetical protein
MSERARAADSDRDDRVSDDDPARRAETEALLASFAPALGLDAAAVPVHTDATAARALAGRDAVGLADPDAVWLDPERFDPETPEGRALLAHELTHVAQRELAPRTADADVAMQQELAEAEAHAVMAQVAAGGLPMAPEAPLPANAEAECGPQAMAEAAHKAATRKAKPKPKPKPAHVEGHLEIPPLRLDLPRLDLPEAAPGAPAAKDCPQGCPDPDPAHTKAAVRIPAAPDKPGDPGVHTLAFGGHVVRLRVPESDRPGPRRVTFQPGASPFEAVALRYATVTESESGHLSGTVVASVHLGRFVSAPAVAFTLKDGVIIGQVKGARVELGGKLHATIDLALGPDGLRGTTTIEARDLRLFKGLEVRSGTLNLHVAPGGRLDAHGEAKVVIGHHVEADLDVCFVDGELHGTLGVAWVKPFPIAPGVKVERLGLSGCYCPDGGVSLTGTADIGVGELAGAAVAVTWRRDTAGTERWSAHGEVTQRHVLSVGELSLFDGRGRVDWDDVAGLAPVDLHLGFEWRGGAVTGALDGLWDTRAGTVAGHGDAEVVGPTRLWDGGPTLTEGHLSAVVEASRLVYVEGAFALDAPLAGQPTFRLACTDARWEVETGELTAHGEATVLRDVTFGPEGGLHAVLRAGHAGFFDADERGLKRLYGALNVSVAHGADEIGQGFVDLRHDAGAAGLDGELRFGLTGRWGLPDFAAGPLFLLPGGELSATLTGGQPGRAELLNGAWELRRPGQPGLVAGALAGAFDFGTGLGDLHGDWRVVEAWDLVRGPLGALTLKEGGAGEITVAQSVVTRCHGALPFSGSLTPPKLDPICVEGTAEVDYDPATGALAGGLDAHLVAPVSIPVGAGGDRLELLAGQIGGHVGPGGLDRPMTVALGARYHRADGLVLEGSLADGALDPTTGALSGKVGVGLAAAVAIAPAGRFDMALAEGTRVSGDLDGGALVNLAGETVLAASIGGVRVLEARVAAVWNGEALSGTAAMKVVNPLPLGARALGDHVFGVELAPGTSGQVRLVDNVPVEVLGTAKVAIVADGQPFARGDFAIACDLSGADPAIDADGAVAITGAVPLGVAGDLELTLTGGSNVSASVRGSALAALTGELDLAVATADAGPVGHVHIGATWTGGTSPDLSGAAHVVLERTLPLGFDAHGYRFALAPSALDATLTQGRITHVGGHVVFRAEAVAGRDQAPLGTLTVDLRGDYDRPGTGPGDFTGAGRAEVAGRIPVGQAGDFAIALTAGAGVEVDVEHNALVRVHGGLSATVDPVAPQPGEGPGFLSVSGNVTYLPADGGLVDADAAAFVTGARRLVKTDRYAFWLHPSRTAAAHVLVEKNDVVSVGGEFSCAVHDDGGELLQIAAHGAWTRASGQLSGDGQVTLVRDVRYPRGGSGGPYVVLKRGTSGHAAIDESALAAIDGQLCAEVGDADGPLLEVTGQGRYDAVRDDLERLDGGVTLLRALRVPTSSGADLLRVESLTGEAHLAHGLLVSATGELGFVVPALEMRGVLRGGVARGADGALRAWGDGTLDFDRRGRGKGARRLAGQLTAGLSRDGGWHAEGQLHYALASFLAGDVDVAIDEALDPVVSAGFDLPPRPLLNAAHLLDLRLDALPPMELQAGPINLELGVAAGLGVQMEQLLVSGHVGFRDWRPLTDPLLVPDLTATLTTAWGVAMEADVKTWLTVAVGIPLLRLGVRATGGASVELPVHLTPRVTLERGPDGLDGRVELGVSLAPTLKAIATLGFIADAGPVHVHGDLDPVTAELGTPAIWTWSTAYTFGDGGTHEVAPKERAAATTGGQTQPRSEVATQRPSFPEQAPRAPAPVAEGPQVAAPPGFETDSGAGGQLDELVRKGKLVADVAKGLAALARLVALLAGLIAGLVTAGPVGFAVMLIIEIVFGDLTWDKLVAAGREVARASKALLELCGDQLDGWLEGLLAFVSGERPNLLDALFGADDKVRAEVAAGKHEGLPPKGRGRFIEVMMAGYCGDEDEDQILEILRFSERNGDLHRVIGCTLGGWRALHHNLDGVQNDALWELLERNGYQRP